MPENLPKKPVLDKIKGLFNTYERDKYKNVNNLEADGLERLGEGKDSVVWKYGDRVIKIDKRVGEFSPAQQKQIFYTHRILHTLFPDNFLAPSLAIDQTKDSDTSLSIWDIVGGEQFGIVGNNNTGIHQIKNTLYDIGLRPQFDFTGHGNIVTVSGGKEVYVDTIRNFINSSRDIDKILDFMDKQGRYTEEDKRIVVSSGKRLVELQKI